MIRRSLNLTCMCWFSRDLVIILSIPLEGPSVAFFPPLTPRVGSQCVCVCVPTCKLECICKRVCQAGKRLYPGVVQAARHKRMPILSDMHLWSVFLCIEFLHRC